LDLRQIWNLNTQTYSREPLVPARTGRKLAQVIKSSRLERIKAVANAAKKYLTPYPADQLRKLGYNWIMISM
jgi:hypothetical protein